MDQRQTQIREGAGLEESRLNVEFIDLLRKWSSPVLLVAAVAAFGYWGWQKLQESRLNKLNTAFSQLEAASAGNDPSPDSLRGVAAEYGTVRAVGTMARLQTADVYLKAVRLGLKVGAQAETDPNGPAKFKPEDVLTDEDRGSYLSQAEAQYKQVVEDNRGKPGMNVLHMLDGLYGLAAVSECRGDLDQAKAYYEQVSTEAQKAGLDAHVALAKAWIDGLDAIKTIPKVYNAADLPKPPAPPVPPEPAPGDNPAPGDGTPAPEGGQPPAQPGDGQGDQPQGDPKPEVPPADPKPEPQPEPQPEPKPDQPK